MPLRPGAYTLAKKGVARFDWRDPYHILITLGWPSFFLTFILTDLALNVLFAGLYMLQPGDIAHAQPGSFADAFFFSMETLATVGYGLMAPVTTYGHVVSVTEILVGLCFTAIATGLTFVRFSKAKAKILNAEKAVITRHHGHPTLMIRIANGRNSMMTDVRGRLAALVAETTPEGVFFRRIHDLALERDWVPIFGLTWTLMHRIDESSPLHGLDHDALVAGDVRLFLNVEGQDYALGARVQDTWDYPASEIVFGMRYADAVSHDAVLRTTADLTRLSLLEPEDDPA